MSGSSELPSAQGPSLLIGASPPPSARPFLLAFCGPEAEKRRHFPSPRDLGEVWMTAWLLHPVTGRVKVQVETCLVLWPTLPRTSTAWL